MRIIFAMMVLPLLAVCFSPPANPPAPQLLSELDSAILNTYRFYIDRGIPISPHSNLVLLDELYKWMGTPHTSRAGRKGIDCSGLVKKVYAPVFNLQLAGSSGDIFRQSQEISREELQTGDLVFFTINAKRINHVGIHLGNGLFAHSSSHSGVSINGLHEPYYSRHFYKAARPSFKDLDGQTPAP